MARYPLGNQRTGLDRPSLLIDQEKLRIDRWRDPLAPPEDFDSDARIIPVALWHTIQEQDIRTRANGMAVNQDAADMGFNVRLDGVRERMGQQFRTSVDPNQFAAPFETPFDPNVGIQREAFAHKVIEDQLSQALAREYRASVIEAGIRPTLVYDAEGNVFAEIPGIGETNSVTDWWGRQRQVEPGAEGVGSRLVPLNQPRFGEGTRFVPLDNQASATQRFLGEVAQVIGPAFDGKRFVQHLVTHTVAAAEFAESGGEADIGQLRRVADERFDELYEESPRVFQLFIEQMSPAELALIVASGGLSAGLSTSTTPAVRTLGAVLRPLGSESLAGTLSVAPRELAAGVGARLFYEHTEGAPMPVRLAAGAAGALVGASPETILNPTARLAKNGLLAYRNTTQNIPIGMGVRIVGPEAIPGPAIRLSDSIPDVLPRDIPANMSNLREAGASHTLAGQRRFSLENNALDRAIDLTSQRDVRLPKGAAHALNQAPPFIGDQTTRMQRFNNWVNQATGIPHIRQAYVAEGNWVSEIGARIFPSRRMHFQRLGELFGGLDDAPLGVYAGPDVRLLHGKMVPFDEHPLTGKLVDHMENPGLYKHTPAQTAELQAFNNRNSGVSEVIRDETGASIGEFVGEGMHRSRHFVPILNRTENVLGTLDSNARARAVAGRLSERSYNSITDRLADPLTEKNFIAETSVEALYNALDDAKSFAGGREIFRLGVGGQVGTSGVPPAREIVSLDPVRPRKTLEDEALEIQQEMRARGAEVDLDTAHGMAVQRRATQRVRTAQPAPAVQAGTQAPSPEVSFRVEGFSDDLFFNKAEADALQQILKNAPDNIVINGLELFRQTRLNGDLSPLTIQGALSFATSPWDTATQLSRSLADGSASKIFDPDALADDIVRDPDSWIDFAFNTGLTVAQGTPSEFQTGLIQRIPVIGRGVETVNDGLSSALLRAQKRDYDEFVAMFGREATGGIPEGTIAPDGSYILASETVEEAVGEMIQQAWYGEARAAARTAVRRSVPRVDVARLGQSRGRSVVERAAVTSVSFIRNPLAHMAEAARGYAKLAALGPVDDELTRALPLSAQRWKELTPDERLATLTMTKLAGTLTGMSTATALLTADERGMTIEEALQRNLTPGGADFLKLWFTPDLGVGIGGPYRSFIQAMAPKDGIPFSGFLPFGQEGKITPQVVESRTTPFISSFLSIRENEDFFGEELFRGERILQLGQALMFAGEQTLPISVAAPLETRRRGLPFEAGVEATISEFFGQNVQRPSAAALVDRARRQGAMTLSDMEPEQLLTFGMTPDQIEAAGNFRTLHELRDKIGTRSANALSEQANVDSSGAQEAYRADLERRALRNDRTAQALLVSLDLQDQLTVLASEVRLDGAVDKESYRTQRSGLVATSVGASEVFAQIFKDFEQSDSEIDVLSAEWYSLFEHATPSFELNGREVSLGLDVELFNELESEFFSNLPPETAALIEDNVAAAPSGANPLEVELRQTRRDLEAAGFWDVGEDLWKETQSFLVQSEELTDAQQALFKQSNTFAEFEAAVIDWQLGVQLEFFREKGLDPDPDTILKNAQKTANSVLGPIRDARASLRVKWAVDHGSEDGLVEQAIQWGYLSTRALGVSGALDESAPAEQSGTEPQSMSASQMADLFKQGRTWNQIAARTGRTPGSARMAVTRFLGDISPSDARAEFQNSL